ncbi:MAG: zinc finger domain-containing protein [Candidatus Andersenbacteria bacterium]
MRDSKSAEQWYVYPPDRFTRVAFKLAPRRAGRPPDVLHYSDIRKFGRLWLIPVSKLATLPELRDLGPEPLDKKFSSAEFVRCMRRYRGMVKPILLNQSCVAGVGNIYADESLFDAGIHPKTRIEKLSDAELALLGRMVVANLSDAVGHRGSSVGEFTNVQGDAGKHGSYLRVYQQTGKPCGVRRGKPRTRCAGIVKRIVVGQRGTHLCPVCQKVRR